MELITELPIKINSNLNVLDAIFSRRAVRSYLSKQVSPDIIEELLSAAIQAPSAMNKQPWAFIVIQQQETLKKISDQAKFLLLKNQELKASSEHGAMPLSDLNLPRFSGHFLPDLSVQKMVRRYGKIGKQALHFRVQRASGSSSC